MIVWGLFRAGLDPAFADGCDRALGPLAAVFVVTCGARSRVQQAADYAKGRTTPGPIITQAKPGQSAHEADMPGALAIDGVLRRPDGTTTYNTADPGWQAIIAAVRASPDLHSGADFPPIAPADADHIEAYRWAHSVGGHPSVRSALQASGQWDAHA